MATVKIDERPRIVTYVGADGRALQFTATDADGAAYNLTSLTLTIAARSGNDDGTVVIDDQPCTVTTAASGQFEYTPTAAELASAGDLFASVKVVNGSSKVDFLEPFIIEVREPMVGNS